MKNGNFGFWFTRAHVRAKGECAANSLGVLEAPTGGMLKVQEKLGYEGAFCRERS